MRFPFDPLPPFQHSINQTLSVEEVPSHGDDNTHTPITSPSLSRSPSPFPPFKPSPFIHARSDTVEALTNHQRYSIVESYPPCIAADSLTNSIIPTNVHHIPVPATTWFLLTLFPVHNIANAVSWLQDLTSYGVMALRFSRKSVVDDGKPSKSYRDVELLFKSREKAMQLAYRLSELPQAQLFVSSFRTLDKTRSSTLTLFTKYYWLPYIAEIYENAASTTEFEFLLGRAPLHPASNQQSDFRWVYLGQDGMNTPLLPPSNGNNHNYLCPPRASRRRSLNVVQFRVDWLEKVHDTLQQDLSPVEWDELRYFLMMLRATTYGGVSKKSQQFIVGMWPSARGVVDKVVRCVALARARESKKAQSVIKRDETFGSSTLR